jgi:hypothetical protein
MKDLYSLVTPIVIGSLPPIDSSIIDPNVPFSVPEMVPEPMMSPVAMLQPVTVWCEIC